MENKELEIIKNELEILVECLPKKYCYQYGLDPKKATPNDIKAIDRFTNKLFKPTPTNQKIYDNIYATPWYPKPEEEQKAAAIEFAKDYNPNGDYNQELQELKNESEYEIQEIQDKIEYKLSHEPKEPIKESKLKMSLMPWLKIEYNKKYEKLKTDIELCQIELKELEKKLKYLKKNSKYSKMEANRKKIGIAEWYRLNSLAEKELPILEEKLQTVIHVPKKYRAYFYAEKLLDIIVCQRADTLKEACNILEEEIAEENYREKMQDIEEEKVQAIADGEIERTRLMKKDLQEKQAELKRHHEEMESQARAQTRAMEEQAEAIASLQSTEKNYDSTRCLGCKYRNYCDRKRCNFFPGRPV